MSGPASVDPAALFAPIAFPSSGSVLVAVSGGSDSTALLVLLHDHLKAAHPGLRLVAATVDHRLRPGSAQEARQVASFCAACGIDHHLLEWRGGKPAAGLSAAARLARYSLVKDCAEREDAGMVFLGHTADDQAETLAMRAGRTGSGYRRGDAGMAVATLFREKLWLMRPLLGVTRSELRAVLERRGIAWTDDPTNADARFERARLRAAMTDLPHTAGDAARKRRAMGLQAADLIDRHACRPAPGLIRLDHALFHASEPGLYALRALLAVTGGTPHLPSDSATRPIFDAARLERLRRTLSRSVVDVRRDAVYLHRERRGLPAFEQTADLWDRRYVLSAPPGPHAPAPSVAPSVPPRLARDAALAEPPIGLRLRPVLAPWHDFLPDFDLALAGACARLVGADTPPAAPLEAM